MQDLYWKKLEQCLSPKRLEVYGLDGSGARTITARYLWNIAVCESLYAPLHLLEVGLRNAIDSSMTRRTGCPEWYDRVALADWGKTQVESAKTSVTKRKKPLEPGRVVAELQFGFWTSMFQDEYQQLADGFLPGGIKETFPNLPKSLHNRKRIKGDLDRMRNLRNRVFHHERIVHWHDLREQHALILDFVQWISSDLAELATLIDTFPAVHGAGTQPFLDTLDGHLVEAGVLPLNPPSGGTHAPSPAPPPVTARIEPTNSVSSTGLQGVVSNSGSVNAMNDVPSVPVDGTDSGIGAGASPSAN